MAPRARARQIFDRSRVLLDRSRVAAAHLLDPPRHATLEVVGAGQSAWAEAARNESLVDLCSSIALRDLNLIDTLLSELEVMERSEEDSKRLSQLYRLDHLTARLRRNAENLRVLADHDTDESGGDTTSVLDTVRAAMSSIDQYARISIGRMVSLGVVGFAADDLSRVLTELLDNAANHTPPNARVRVSAHLTEQGSVMIRIEDEGIGLPHDRLVDLNSRLSRALRLDNDAVRHMGLAVVRRLAERHDLRVSLHRRLPNGTTANVLVPPSLVTDLSGAEWSGTRTVPAKGRFHQRPVSEPVSEPEPVSESESESEPESEPESESEPEQEQGPRDADPVPANGAAVESAAVTAPFGLPRRGEPPAPRSGTESPAPQPSPKPRPQAPTISGTTASGLPRRVSRSIKNAPGTERTAPQASEPDAADSAEGHEKFLADLGDFADGEQAAHAHGKGNSADGENGGTK